MWQIWVDTGGTFTDCIAISPEGEWREAKVLSSSALRVRVVQVLSEKEFTIHVPWELPDDFFAGFSCRVLGENEEQVEVATFEAESCRVVLTSPLKKPLQRGQAVEFISPEEAPVLAARLVTGTPLRHPLPPISMRLATTRGTNALLERKGAPVVLFITEGFEDLLEIGTQQRPDLFALHIRKPEPVYATVCGVPERLDAAGKVVKPLDVEKILPRIRELIRQGYRCAAIALMHSYRNPVHERQLAELLRQEGFAHISVSSDLSPFAKLLFRAETTVVDAYLSPVIRNYLANVQEPLQGRRLHVMTSAGGLVQARHYHPKDSLLSGPAGGVVGAAHAGKQAGITKIIAFDMGGTSTDVSRYDGDYEYVFEHTVGHAHLVSPALAIESVAAGGGSICWFDGVSLRVGPESAGAHPGPACYGAGGPLTLTDVNLLLGRLDPRRFEIPINPEAARHRLNELKKELLEKTGESPGDEEILEGFLAIANERMADAIRDVSLRKGYDPAEFTLVAFGGAGAQHVCGVANRLGISQAIIPARAGLLSAFGLGHAVVERFAERQILRPLDEVLSSLSMWFGELAREAMVKLQAEGISRSEILIRRRTVHLRFVGQDFSVEIDFEDPSRIREAFREKYTRLYGHWLEDRAIEVESLRVIASTRPPEYSAKRPILSRANGRAIPRTTCSAWFDGAWKEIPCYDRKNLLPGVRIEGPCLVLERHSTTVIEPGWSLEVGEAAELRLQRKKPEKGAPETRPKSVQIELFTNRFEAITREMGAMLERTALSTNIKERLDFSCALLDSDAELVVNAPHIPVHLGAMGICVREVRRVLPMQDGDVIITNHPKFGGSHLPDVTLITPVYSRKGILLGYVANRAHHAEIGGIQPGSMPPLARNLAEEGVVIPPMYLVHQGREQWEKLERILRSGPYPSRAVEENLADIRAALAANYRGARLLREMADQYGDDTVLRFMEEIKKKAEIKIREALSRLQKGEYRATERLDDGSHLCVSMKISGEGAVIDFSGSAPVHPGNLNATPAIVTSAVMYVLRLLLQEDFPLNEGMLHAVEIRIPPGILSPDFPEDPSQCPAVVGGNVETSQRLVDTLLRPLEMVACSQGTMNNTVWGTDRFSYYETVCGGCGAGDGFHGASAVHSHMTNTRITDPEIIELRYPVRIMRFAIRRGSGGKGKFRGGDGVIREILFLERMRLAVLTQHRVERPYGLKGGEPGAPGLQFILRADGTRKDLSFVDGAEIFPGDRFILMTPGGGGFGDKR